MSTFSLFSLFTARDVIKAVSSALHLSPSKFDKDLDKWQPSVYARHTEKRFRLLINQLELHEGQYYTPQQYTDKFAMKIDFIRGLHTDNKELCDLCYELANNALNKKYKIWDTTK